LSSRTVKKSKPSIRSSAEVQLIIERPVPTNVITGFLGAGKTTAIRALLRNKPVTERWAVLVNEFGEIGVDAGLLGGASDGELFIREVPGGCMCCAAGLPMQVALNQLVSAAKPDRLFIEPTGLGHPKEVVKTLQQPEYGGVLDVRAVVTLVDARKVDDTRYTRHETFRQQLEVADCIVANKEDLYVGNEVSRLRSFLNDMGLQQTPLHVVSQAELQLEWLAPVRLTNQGKTAAAASKPLLATGFHATTATLPAEGYLRRSQALEGFFSVGWVFRKDFVFDHDRLYCLLSGIAAERVKVVAVTNQGVVGFNLTDAVLTSMLLEQAEDSRIEVISSHELDSNQLEQQLFDSLASDAPAVET